MFNAFINNVINNCQTAIPCFDENSNAKRCTHKHTDICILIYQAKQDIQQDLLYFFVMYGTK